MTMYFYKFSPAKLVDAMIALELVGATNLSVNEVDSSITVTFDASLDETDKKLLAFYGSVER